MTSQVGVYGPLKLLRHPDAIQDLKLGVHRSPTHVQIILSDLCSQSCSFCAYRDESYLTNTLFGVTDKDGKRNNNPNRMIPYEKVVQILHDCKDMGVKAVQFTGGGEPCVHPQHPEIFQLAADLGLDYSLVSNGVNFKPGTLESLKKASWVRISIDAGVESTYCSVRRVSPSHWNRALETVKALADLKRSNSLSYILGVGFTTTKENWREVVVAAALYRDLGADNVRISAVFQSDNFEYFRDFYKDASALCLEAEQLKTENFKVFNMFGERIHDLELQSPDYEKCSYQHFTTYIGGDQNIYRCCNTAYSPIGLLGSIKEQSFKDFWSSDECKSKLNAFSARECQRCQFNDRNKLMDYILQPNPVHVNFV